MSRSRPFLMDDCPLAAAIRRGQDDDSYLKAIFDDMAAIVRARPWLLDEPFDELTRRAG